MAYDHRYAGRDHGARRTDLGPHAARPHRRQALPCHLGDIRPDFGNIGDEAGRAIHVGVGRIETINIGKHEVEARPDQSGDDGAQHIVVAKGKLRNGHRVVFVHDRNGPKFQETRKGIARVKVAFAVNDIAAREKNLRAGMPARTQGILIGLGKRCLTGGRASLQGGNVRRPLLDTQALPSHGGRARRDDDCLRAHIHEVSRLAGKRAHVVSVKRPILAHERG